MKKLVTVFATISLVASSSLNATAFTKQKHKNIQQMNNLTSPQTTNEDAEDIANKLWNKTIKIDPNVFLNKNLHTDREAFNTAIVKQGILTKAEAQYVSWANLNINIAGWYWNKGAFTVSKDGATMTGHVTIDADNGESPKQIAQKVATAKNIKFNFNYWNNKAIQEYLPIFREILVNEQVLTKAEASVVAGLQHSTTITKAGQITFAIIVNDNNTSFDANINVNVLDDGSDASQIANSINGLKLGLKLNTARMYADTSYVTRNIVNLLVANYGKDATDMDHIIFPHVKLKKDNPNFKAKVLKDGQTATATLDLECKTGPYIYYYTVEDEYLQVYVNLNTDAVANLKKWFLNSGHDHQADLDCFYEMLDDNQAFWISRDHLYPGSYVIPWTNRLDQNMGSYGSAGDTAQKIIEYESDVNNSSCADFMNELYNAVINSNGYLSFMFEWEYSRTFTKIIYGMQQWKFW